MAILDNVKADLGLTSNAFDAELTSAITSAKVQLKICGVNVIDDTDALTETAIKLYCRYWKNFQGDAERYNAAFRSLADAMALSGDYNTTPPGGGESDE